MIAVIFAYLLFVVILAWDNAKRIGQDKHIKHWLNGLAHFSMAGILYFVDWRLSVALLFLVKLVFDSALNTFRKNGIDYISPDVKKISSLWSALIKGKFVDYIEYEIFGNNGYTPKIFYLIIAVCLLIVR